MKCCKCGKELPPDSRFCDSCGASQTQASWQGAPPSGGTDPGGGSQAKKEQDSYAGQQSQYAWQNPSYSQQNPNQTPSYTDFHLKADRSLVTYILLSIITFGIYGLYFIYTLSCDVNVACNGDGTSTPGLVKFILLSLITCGIYSYYWYYSLGNRLAANAPRYGMNFQENGTTVLLWDLFGALLCGIGPLVAMHIIIKNTNSLCGAYNAYFHQCG